MFIIVSFLLSAAILATFYYCAQTRKVSYQSKHTAVSYLRQILHLCRQHRATTHEALVKGHHSNIDIIASQLNDTMQQLLNHASLADKPVYRILQTKIHKMTTGWQTASISQNQICHGKVIRHCLLLIDEIMITWVLEAQRQELSDEYHQSWHQIIDSLDSLTQFRIAIQDMENDTGNTRLGYLSKTLHRRLTRLSLVNPIMVSSPAFQTICTHLEAISEDDQFSSESLYQLSSDISLMIFNVYDYILTDVAEHVYVPLPTLAIPA
ncbi:hypothetical protein CSW98_03425 [Vibrio sp. HA2012]|uniref:hypothetical protein n=1 Tax=Vibrio sp. HA2012 TaxID=1971595 RepID=UPI000C2B6156|nr:hypothetical protein [Vibrio sp. HA2012]PJC88185.1 hypothetical protein CSW98_03425 [Vibrio sp. HA2012]